MLTAAFGIEGGRLDDCRKDSPGTAWAIPRAPVT